ncbi:MAG: hypothetical protein JSU68_04010 [Phycisphaerales bacterium]|nr:MAG: hypothetical protein JSU68_04010 [Phycisphaerales bacterium]
MSSDLQSQIASFLAQHSRKITIAGGGLLAGVLLVLVVIFVLDLLFAPPVPDIDTASPATVAAFLAHPRGFSRMSIDGRRKILADLYLAGHDKLNELADEFDRMSMEEREQVRSAAMDVYLDQLAKDARRYRTLPPQDQDEFVEEVLDNYETLKEELRPIGDSFKDNLPTKSDEWTKVLVSKTSPRERSRIKPLVDHITRAAEDRRKAEARQARHRSREW